MPFPLVARKLGQAGAPAPHGLPPTSGAVPTDGTAGVPRPSDQAAKLPGSKVKANQREIFFSCRV